MEILMIFLILTLVNLLLGSLVVPFPVSDSGTVRYNTIPYATIGLIAANCLLFVVWQAPDLITLIGARGELESFNAQVNYARKIGTYGFRADFLREGLSIGAFTTFTSTFMHADFTHLTGNMIFLWAFGRRVEDACGPWRFLVFYLFAGTVAALGYAILAPRDMLPTIGASGAIFGVMGAYLLLFPGARMNCLWVIGIGLKIILRFMGRLSGEKPGPFRWTVQLPAFFVLVLYAGFNVLPTFQTIEEGRITGGVNVVAHMTGFLSALAIFLFVRKDLLMRYVSGRAL